MTSGCRNAVRVIAALAVASLLFGVGPAYAGSAPVCGARQTLAFSNVDIFRVDVDGTHLKLLGRDGLHPAWSPDGSRIAYDREGSGNFAPGDIYVVVANGQAGKGLTRDGKGFFPLWAPDGRRIYFSDANGGGRFVIDADGTDRRQIPARLFPDSWSHDGRRFAAVGNSGLWISDADGRRRRLVARGDVSDPKWSPDDRMVAYSVDGTGKAAGIYVVRVDGSAPPKHLAGANTGYPTWSPSGRELAYAVNALGHASSVYIIDVTRGHRRPVVRRAVSVDDLSWSPNGEWLAYTVGPVVKGRPYDVFVVRPDGSGRRNLTGPLPLENAFTAAESPAWQPCRRR